MRWCIWFTNDQDGVVVRSGKIPLFVSEPQARAFAAGWRLPLEPEAQAPFQFDRALSWLETGRSGMVDCSVFLDLFNLCTDGVTSLGQRASWERAEFNPVYDKLFFGCNLPGITPPGKRYVPFWRRKELRTLRKSLRLAIDQFLAAVEFIAEADDLTEARS
jgi:hypothetical protein